MTFVAGGVKPIGATSSLTHPRHGYPPRKGFSGEHHKLLYPSTDNLFQDERRIASQNSWTIPTGWHLISVLRVAPDESVPRLRLLTRVHPGKPKA
jgi:hypothetical protein